MKKNMKLETRIFYTEVTELFNDIKDDAMNAQTFTLGQLKEIVDELVASHGLQADISVELEGDEFYPDWTWHIATERQETLEEYNTRITQEKERIAREKKWAMQKEKEEKKEYLRLKKKFETKNAKK
jgi:hypothetical protein